MKLTLRKCEHMGDWYIIERAEHDGRTWIEYDSRGGSLMCSSRISDADVEGDGVEMLAIAAAIESRGSASFKRCSVEVRGDIVHFSSPRNSREPGVCTLREADELAALIRENVAA